MKNSLSSVAFSNPSSIINTNISVISLTLQGIMEMYGVPRMDEKIRDTEQAEQSTKLSVVSTMQNFQTKRDDHSRNNLISVLQGEYITKKQDRDNAIKKRDNYLAKAKEDQEKDTRTSGILAGWSQSLSHSVSAFFETTNEQLAAKYDRVAQECTQHQSALAHSIDELQNMSLAESEPSTEPPATKSTPPLISLATLEAKQGVKISGETIGDNAGSAVSAGDFNGDGYSDVLVGAPYQSSHTGAAYVVYGSRDIGENGTIPLSGLTQTTGLKLSGESPYDQLTGSSVSVVGDVNGDHYSELLIGAEGYYGNTGRSYLVFGGPNVGAGGRLPLASVNASTGVKIYGETMGDFAGIVSSAGDVNDDRRNDLLIGAPGYGDVSGRSYVLFGSSTIGSNGQLMLNSLDGDNGYIVEAEINNSYTGYPVIGIGDFNRDGRGDFAIGAPFYNGYIGRIYVIYGGSHVDKGGRLLLSSLDGTTGTRIDGENPGDYAGWSIGAGDFNRDGAADLLIGAPFYNKTGRSYIVYGGENVGRSGRIALSQLSETKSVIIDGEAPGDDSGFAVAALGDIDGGGYADFIIGARSHNVSRGRSYIVFSEFISSSQVDLTKLNGINGFRVDGEAPNDFSGYTVGDGGDINGDLGDDVIIGAPGYDKTGRVYVIFGAPNTTRPHPPQPPHSLNPFRWFAFLTILSLLAMPAYKEYKKPGTIKRALGGMWKCCGRGENVSESTGLQIQRKEKEDVSLNSLPSPSVTGTGTNRHLEGDDKKAGDNPKEQDFKTENVVVLNKDNETKQEESTTIHQHKSQSPTSTAPYSSTFSSSSSSSGSLTNPTIRLLPSDTPSTSYSSSS